MELYLYRIIENKLFYIEHVTDGVLSVIGDEFVPPKGSSILDWAIMTCKYMADFYLKHKIKASHAIAVQKGWTVEYVFVD